MIISTNKEPSLEEFEEICNKACQLMNERASYEPEYYLTKGGQKLEKEVKKACISCYMGNGKDRNRAAYKNMDKISIEIC